jgi:cell wall-associated NlpC family hydrolase
MRTAAPWIAVTAMVMMFIAACSSTPRLPQSRPEQDGQGAVIAGIAMHLVGTPYQFGGADAQGFDCSGLAVYAHEAVGLDIPRTARDQDRAAQPVALSDLQPGDLVFFRISARHVNHVGIYAGGGRFVHAPRRGEVVSYALLADPYYRKHFVRAGRFWKPS